MLNKKKYFFFLKKKNKNFPTCLSFLFWCFYQSGELKFFKSLINQNFGLLMFFYFNPITADLLTSKNSVHVENNLKLIEALFCSFTLSKIKSFYHKAPLQFFILKLNIFFLNIGFDCVDSPTRTDNFNKDNSLEPTNTAEFVKSYKTKKPKNKTQIVDINMFLLSSLERDFTKKKNNRDYKISLKRIITYIKHNFNFANIYFNIFYKKKTKKKFIVSINKKKKMFFKKIKHTLNSESFLDKYPTHNELHYNQKKTFYRQHENFKKEWRSEYGVVLIFKKAYTNDTGIKYFHTLWDGIRGFHKPRSKPLAYQGDLTLSKEHLKLEKNDLTILPDKNSLYIWNN